jgi:hypothetical protein
MIRPIIIDRFLQRGEGMSSNPFHKMIVMLLLFCILLGLCGCSKKEPEQKPQGENKQTGSKDPETFTNMVNETETLIMEIGKTVKFIEIPVSAQQQGRQQGGQQQQGQQQQGQQQQGQQQQGQQQQGQQQQGQQQQGQQQQGQQQQGQQQQGQQQQGQQPQGTTWSKAETGIRKIHQEWNSLEPEAVKAGLLPEVRDRFEKTMEDLTIKISAQKAEDSLVSAIEMYGFYADIGAVLKSKLPAPAYRLKYEIMIMAAYAYMQNWTLAQNHSSGLTQQWEMLKMKDEGTNSQAFTQSEYALTDFKRAVEMKQKQLVLIKAEIALKNLDELSKKLAQASVLQNNGNKGQDSGQGNK